MEISKKGVDLIKKFEGCKLKAYKCPAGIWTIGYGHTNNVRPDDMITFADAEKLLRVDLVIHSNNVKKLVKVPLTQCQFDALVCFEYNVGYNAFKNSTLLKLLNQNKYDEASNQFERWVFAGNQKLQGLINRRKAEKELFLCS